MIFCATNWTLNSDYNGLKASHDADKAVILKLKTDYEALEQTHDSLIKKFEDLKLEYAAEVDNSENLAKSLNAANTELQLKSDVIRSIPPDYLGALERLQNDKLCCRDRMGREKELEMKNSDLEKKYASREAFLSSLASELFELREKNSDSARLGAVIYLEDQIDIKEKLIKSLKNHINKMIVNKGLSDDSYSYPAVLFDQDTENTVIVAESEVISKKQLKKERQRQKKKLEALSWESSVTIEEIVPEG